MNTHSVIIATLIGTLAACSSAPDRNIALDQAQTQFNSARNNSQIASLATQELAEAKEALHLAQLAWEEKEDQAKVDHLAYLASQRVTIAKDTAASLAAQATTASASAERDKLLLMVRTNQADRAEQRATQSEQRSTLAIEALAAAKTDAAETARQREARIRDLESSLKDLNAKQTERGLVVTLGDVLFNTGQSEILASAAPNLSKLANFLKRYPQQRASIEGYTDSTGSVSGNYALSQRRANAVQAALINLGVNRDQLSTQAHGQDNPIADNSTAVGRQLNRRVEVVFEQAINELPLTE